MPSLDKAFSDFLKALRGEQSYASLASSFGSCFSVAIIPGATQLTAISGARALAMTRVSMCSAALDEQ